MLVTRRTLMARFACVLGLGAAGGAVGLPPVAQAADNDPALQLQHALDDLCARLPSVSRLDVLGVETRTVRPQGVAMVAHVRMTWAPGQRDFPFAGDAAPEADHAFQAMRAGVVAHIEDLQRPHAPLRRTMV